MRIQDVSVNAWWAAEPEHRGQAMLGVVTQLRNRQRPRVDLAERQLAYYIGCQTSELTPDAAGLLSLTVAIRSPPHTGLEQTFPRLRAINPPWLLAPLKVRSI